MWYALGTEKDDETAEGEVCRLNKKKQNLIVLIACALALVFIVYVLSAVFRYQQEQADQPESKPESKPAKRELYTFDRLYEKYAAQEGVTSILFGKRMMQMMADRVRDEDRELAKLLEELRSIRVLTNAHPSAQFEADARSILKKLSGWELISQIEEHGQQIDSYLFDGGRWHPSTFLLFSFGDKEQVVLYIQGYFSVKDISRLSEIRPN